MSHYAHTHMVFKKKKIACMHKHGWSFSEKVGGVKWFMDWMFCYAKVGIKTRT